MDHHLKQASVQPVRAGKRRRVHNLAFVYWAREREREGTAEQKDIDYLVDNNRGTTRERFALTT